MKINAGDTAWVLGAAALVLFMTPGLALFYGGMVRAKNMLAMLMQNFICMGIVTVLWVVVGYSLAFGRPGDGGLLGNFDFVGMKHLGNASIGTIPALAFVSFQLTFAVITPALITGAIADRMRFSAWAVFVTLWSLLVYAPVAHWVFSGGWLATRGALDMHDRSAREVERAARREPTAREHPVRNRGVHEQRPQGHEDRPRGESHPVRDGAGDQRRGDHRERHLERHERQRRDRSDRRVAEMLHADEVEVAEQPTVTGTTERERVTDDHPQNRHDAHADEVLHQHCEHVLRADHAAVEQSQPGRHEQHERRRAEHPRGVPCVDLHRPPAEPVEIESLDRLIDRADPGAC